jgi:cation diffusion facilitator CzcD-associated flavoprotein CzcO
VAGTDRAKLVDVVIIGAGISGIGAAIRPRQAGFHDVVVLEKADSLGGTWRDNTYPGCACNVPSALYSYAFAQKGDWSRVFAPQAEIAAYV